MLRVVPTFLVSILVGAAGCTDFQTPAELTAPQIIAVVADPPVVAPGATSQLTLVIAGPDGPIAATGTRWSLAETYPGVPPMGTIDGASDGTATYTAPTMVPELPEGAVPLDAVQVDLTLEGAPKTTIKAVAVSEVMASNPAITSVTVDGAPVDSVAFHVGESVELGVATEPAPADDWRFAWYAAAGEIEKYQSSPTTITATEAGSGFLFVVVRDATVGAAWLAVPIAVD